MGQLSMGTDTFVEHLAADAAFRFAEAERMFTPALVIDRDRVQHNIQTTLRLLGGDANRWRHHVKTAKLGYVMRMLVEAGVQQFKCATSLELSVACEAGARDVLVAYPLVGANAARVRQIAEHHPGVLVSVLVENEAQLVQWKTGQWKGTPVGIFIDVNPGMNRTGVPDDRGDAILRLAQSIVSSGSGFRGLHYYDGHLSKFGIEERCKQAHAGYERLMQIVDSLAGHRFEPRGLPVPEVITAGTPAFPCSLSFPGFKVERLQLPRSKGGPFLHRVSPGTVVYCDTTSLAQLAPKPGEMGSQLAPDLGYQPAAVVMTRVVSHPAAGLITCDAGHKTVSADAGVPTCAVVGHPELEPLAPSEEHLPMRVNSPHVSGNEAPAIGELLFLIPRHVCPTVNNFDEALIVSGGKLIGIEPVSARGRERQDFR